MAKRLAERLTAARRRQFVGRDAERALFGAALAAPDLPFCVLYIFGPGGVGKTTLLGEFAALCQQAGVVVAALDGRNIDPSPTAFRAALHTALGGDPARSAMGAGRRQVLLVDTYELLAPLDSWLRDRVLPELPASLLVVLASRQPPAPAWRADPGWQTLIRVLPLRNLSPSESRAYLARRAIPPAAHQPVLDFTHGHPLALSLVAEVFAQRPSVDFHPAADPDIIRTLLEQFVERVPGPVHRAALEACALVRVTTEALLAQLLGLPDVHELFAWLRGLSFIESGPRGLFPHDLAREALAADLRWRNPDRYAELHGRARAYYARCLQQLRGSEQQRMLFDYVFLHRESPLVRPFLEWQESGTSAPDRMAAADQPAVLEMIRQHEGQQSAHLAAHWFARQPHNVVVYRDADGQPSGLLLILALHEARQQDVAADPATRAAWAYLQHHAPLRPGEGAGLVRFWLARDSYQAVSATQSLIFVNICQYYFNTPGLAFSFFPCADPAFWAPAFAYMDLERLPTAEYTVAGRPYGVFGHDWRIMPPLAWLDLLAERELASAPLERRPQSTLPLVVLSGEAFAGAVREALQHLGQPEVLRDNPLLRARLVVEAAGASADAATRLATLHTLIAEAAEGLKVTPRGAKAYRALYHTYLHPAATQEQAAEILDLPFSTYRRHLKMGVTQLVATLWQRELSGGGA